MANLIIKPTSGGSLILQDEGGTAAHTIDANGNHTLSGSTNNLGTVTAGTLSSAVGFPSGHVLQTASLVGAGSAATTTSTSWVQVDAQEVSMTALQTNGKYNVELFSGRIDANAVDNISAYTCFVSANGAAYANMGNPPTSYADDIGFGKFNAGAYEGYGGFHGVMYTATITAGQTIKFKPYMRKVSGGSSTIYMNNGVRWQFIVREIKL